MQNRGAIRVADEVHIFYSSKSQGTHFDMGVAFALDKKIIIVESEEFGEGKSFARMLTEWSDLFTEMEDVPLFNISRK
jgi:nucleoside 2-deoxyribosyltransferase